MKEEFFVVGVSSLVGTVLCGFAIGGPAILFRAGHNDSHLAQPFFQFAFELVKLFLVQRCRLAADFGHWGHCLNPSTSFVET